MHPFRQGVPDCAVVCGGISFGMSTLGVRVEQLDSRGTESGPLEPTYPWLEWTVDGDDLTADYLLDAGLFGRNLMTVRVTETFRIPADDHRIHHITAKIRPARAKHT